MKEYTAKEMKLLKANPYTFKVTKNKLYFTIEFKKAFWIAYQAGMAPRKILEDLGYDLEMFGQKQIDSIVQRIKHQAQCGSGFRQGENRTRRKKDELSIPEETSLESKEALEEILNEVKYLRQEVEFLKKNCKNRKYSNEEILMSFGWKFEVIQKTLNEADNQLSVSMLCEIAGVSRSGYYRWVKAVDVRDKREKKDREDFELILKAYNQRGYSKGARGIHMCMLHWNPPIVMNVKKIRRLMDKYSLMCPIRRANLYRRMAKALRTSNVADNLLKREFTEHGPRRVLLTDITYIPYNGTFAYLSTILDAYTKQILSYVLSDSLEVDFVLETVEKLIREHGVELTKETLIHSDQGCHYTSASFIRLVNDKELRQSMSRKGNCWDNAPQESFFGHMKDEIDVSGCEKYRDVRAIVDDWIDYYNNERYQWQLAKLSPNEYYGYITTGIYPLKGIIDEREKEQKFPKTN